MTPDTALDILRALGDPERAAGAKAYHKSQRVHLGVPNPVLNDLTTDWRRGLTVETRVDLAAGLWQSDIFEARIAAAKLLTQARITPDAAVWELICNWVPAFDGWAIADHVAMAGQRRLKAEPQRLDSLAPWTQSEHLWTKRAALVMTLPWAKQNTPKPDELAARERILGWAAGYVADKRWFIQKAISWWLRDLSKRDATRVQGFLEQYGDQMKPFARREAAKYLK